MNKTQIAELLERAGVASNLRAEQLSMQQFADIANALNHKKIPHLKVRDFLFVLQESNWFFSWFLKVCKTPCNACLEAFCRKGFGT